VRLTSRTASDSTMKGLDANRNPLGGNVRLTSATDEKGDDRAMTHDTDWTLASHDGRLIAAEEMLRAYQEADGFDPDGPTFLAYVALVQTFGCTMARAAEAAVSALKAMDRRPVWGDAVTQLCRSIDRLVSGGAPCDLAAFFDTVPEAGRGEIDAVVRRFDM